MAATLIIVTAFVFVSTLYLIPNFLRVLRSWKWLIKGRVMMQEQFRKSPHQALSILIPGNRLHVMHTEQHWADFSNATTSQLSANAASREMFQPKYTLGFDWGAPREQVSLATVRSIRNMTAQLPVFQQRFLAILDDEFSKAIISSHEIDGWYEIPLWDTVQRSMTRMSSALFLGEEAANSEEFLTRGLKYISQVSLVGEAVRLVPTFLAPLVANLIKGRNEDQEFVFSTIARLVDDRIAYNGSIPEPSRKKQQNFLEGFVDQRPNDFTTANCVESINTGWIIPTLSIPIVASHLVQDMFTHTEHLPALRAEAKSVSLSDATPENNIAHQVNELKLLEAFTMESMRTKCFQSNTCHRVAVKPFTFSDGYKVPAGEAVEFSSHHVLSDSETYPNPRDFNVLNYLEKGKSIVDTGMQWPFWGVQRLICPGRWYVANAAKLLAVFLLVNFECKVKAGQKLNFEWRDSLVPDPKAKLLVRRVSKS